MKRPEKWPSLLVVKIGGVLLLRKGREFWKEDGDIEDDDEGDEGGFVEDEEEEDAEEDEEDESGGRGAVFHRTTNRSSPHSDSFCSAAGSCRMLSARTMRSLRISSRTLPSKGNAPQATGTVHSAPR